MKRAVGALSLLLLTSLIGTIWMAAGRSGLAYALLYCLAVAPGIPLGLAVFGRRHPAGWIGGALVGYGTTQIALWASLAIGIISPLLLVFGWACMSALLVSASRLVRSPGVNLPEWTRRDMAALAVVLLLVPVLMTPPYRNIGAMDANGTKHYRAYFTADFLWHTALAAEIGKHVMPPVNPYLAPLSIHYYWTYFLLPAITAHDGLPPLTDIEHNLKTNAICSATLVIGALFVLVRIAVPLSWPALAAVLLAALAASAEGAWALFRLQRGHTRLSAVTDMNIDAVTNWQFGGLRIDCIPRSLWYNPQHSLSCGLGLIALLVASSSGAVGAPATAFAGLSLGLAVCLNPFVGAVFSMIYGVAIVWQAAERRTVSGVLSHAVAAVPVGLALAWCSVNQMTSGAGASLQFGLHGLAREHPVATLMLSAGPVLLPSLLGLWPRPGMSTQALRTAAAGVGIALALLYFVILGDAAWVGFRAGQILLLMLPILLARALWIVRGLPAGRLLTAALVVAVLVSGLPTTIIDEYNAQDIHNQGMGAGFRWTVTLSAAEQEALLWIREHTPETAVVQMEPIVRGRDEWTLIPAFAERRMAAGLPISLVARPEYQRRSNEIKTMFEEVDPHDAWTIAHHRRIDYIYVDAQDRKAYPAGTEKFDRAPVLFERVFGNAEVEVFRVLPAPVSQKGP